MKVIIPCGSAKRTESHPAKDLYIGAYFKACKDYAFSIADKKDIFILSARYGFIELDKIIEPYNIKFGMRGEIPQFAINQTANNIGITGGALILGGLAYIKRAKAAIPFSIALIDLISRHLPDERMGYQIQWLKNNHGFNPAIKK